MVKRLNPAGAPKPASNYSQAVVHGPGRRMVISGQIGVRPDGTVVDGLEGQMRQAMANLRAVLAAGGFGPEDVVKLTSFCVPKGEVAMFRAIRDEALEGHAPAATWIEVTGLATDKLLFEVEAEAVRED